MSGPSFDVSIAAHYTPSRVPFLVAALGAIGQWKRENIEVRIATNDLALRLEPALQDAVAALESRGITVIFEHATGMAHPFHLTWWHKKHLREWYDRGGSPDDRFMYIEDDMAISNANLDYFDRYLPAAKEIGCIPGLLFYEKVEGRPGTAISFRGSQLVSDDDLLLLDGQRFLNPKFPYWAGFIMDRELCTRYWESPWSTMDLAERQPQSKNHTCRVQSAWALAYDCVPSGLTSRYLIPVDEKLDPLPECYALHTPGNYTKTKQWNFGTMRVDQIFKRKGTVAKLGNVAWKANAMRRRVTDKIRRELAGTRQD